MATEAAARTLMESRTLSFLLWCACCGVVCCDNIAELKPFLMLQQLFLFFFVGVSAYSMFLTLLEFSLVDMLCVIVVVLLHFSLCGMLLLLLLCIYNGFQFASLFYWLKLMLIWQFILLLCCCWFVVAYLLATFFPISFSSPLRPLLSFML